MVEVTIKNGMFAKPVKSEDGPDIHKNYTIPNILIISKQTISNFEIGVENRLSNLKVVL